MDHEFDRPAAPCEDSLDSIDIADVDVVRAERVTKRAEQTLGRWRS